jgi:hypothetical protein
VSVEPDQPQHPDHLLYLQIREGVTKLDHDIQRTYDEISERLTRSLLVLAKQKGLTRVDHVVLSDPTAERLAGHNVFVVQGEIDNPGHRRAAMPTDAAVKPRP